MTVTLPNRITDSQAVQNASSAIDGVQRLLAQQADQLSQAAAELGRNVGSSAGRISQQAVEGTAATARDASASAGSLAQHALKTAQQIGREWMATGQKSARDLGHDLRSLSSDLRQYRITNEPVRTGSDVAPRLGIIAALGAGLGLMYFLDPDQGRRRRALFVDKLRKWLRLGSATVAGRAKDIQNRTVGVVHETRKSIVGVMGQTGDAEAEPTNGSQAGQPITMEQAPERAEVGY